MILRWHWSIESFRGDKETYTVEHHLLTWCSYVRDIQPIVVPVFRGERGRLYAGQSGEKCFACACRVHIWMYSPKFIHGDTFCHQKVVWEWNLQRLSSGREKAKWMQDVSSRLSVSEMRSIMSIFKNKSTSGVQYPNTSADPLSFPSLCENGWSSRVVHHQETSVEIERQARKREADREITEAPPQSLAFSWRGKNKIQRAVVNWFFWQHSDSIVNNRQKGLTWGW